MKKLKTVIPFSTSFYVCIALFFLVINKTSAQGIMDGYYRGGEGLPRCTDFLYQNDSTGRSNIRFKKVIENKYASKDTSLKNKRFDGKEISVFNKNGDEEYNYSIDSTGAVTDSTRYTYDAHSKEISTVYYTSIYTPGKLEAGSGEFITRDKTGKTVKDSSWSRNNEMSATNNREFSVSVENFTFNKAGNLVYDIRIHDDDTTITINVYDQKDRVVAERGYTYHTWSSYAYKYDDSSNVIENVRIQYDDTTKTTSVYDKYGALLQEIRYKNNRLTSKITNEFPKEGGRIETEEVYGTNDTSDGSCLNTRKTITISDKYFNDVSEVTTSLNNGKSITYRKIHKYQYTPTGKILSDSETETTESQWQYSRVLAVITSKYDANGNLTEYMKEGGESYLSNTKTTHTYNEKNLLLETDTYNGCSDKPYEKMIKIYYPDAVTVKEELSIEGREKTSNFYGKDSRKLEDISIGSFGKARQSIYEYEK